MSKQERILAFVGSYADQSTPGVYGCTFDNHTGELTIFEQVDGLQNPTFLEIDSHSKILYALTENKDTQGQRSGAAAAYQIDAVSGKLTLINKESTVTAPTCHITLDHSNQSLMVASYHGGLIGMLPLREDGGIGQTSDVHQHVGSSMDPEDQDKAHPHSVFLDRSNQYAVVPDLGMDKIMIYKLDLSQFKLHPHGEVSVAPGAGPRHFVFHPNLAYGYVISELNSTITAFSFDEKQGSLTEIETVSTFPADFQGESYCADIHLSPDGQFLYGSNRGHDSLVVYKIDAATGKLTVVEYASVQGEHPRNFAISPDGRYVLVANRDTNNITTLVRDAETGKLTFNGGSLNVSKPVCIKFLTIA